MKKEKKKTEETTTRVMDMTGGSGTFDHKFGQVAENPQFLLLGMSATVGQRHFGCTRKTIERLWSLFYVTENVANRPRSGRPRVTTAAVDRYIVLQHLRNRCLTTAATRRQYEIYPQTVRNRLRLNVQPIRAHRPYFGQILTRRHRTARRDLCRSHLHFRHTEWDLTLFSDECRRTRKSLSPSRRAICRCVRH